MSASETQASAFVRTMPRNWIVWRKQPTKLTILMKWTQKRNNTSKHTRITHALKVNCNGDSFDLNGKKAKNRRKKSWKHEKDNENKNEKQWEIVHINKCEQQHHFHRETHLHCICSFVWYNLLRIFINAKSIPTDRKTRARIHRININVNMYNFGINAEKQHSLYLFHSEQNETKYCIHKVERKKKRS